MNGAEPDDGPLYPTRLVGRDEELRTLTERIWDGQKLITLFGPPGVGKTRLAVEALRAASTTGLVGWFCELLDARTEADVATRVLRSIFRGAQIPKGDPREAVIAALAVRGPTSVVVLDNFEHLTRVAGDLVSRWASTCEGTTFVVTSRELMHVPGEVAHELMPLPVPGREEDLESTPATALLLDAIRRYRSTARVEASDRGSIRELAQRLDGLPLALEIVAPRVALLGVSLVHEELDRILASPHAYANAPGRSTRTLHDTIQWSWEMLGPNERIVLAQSTVFRGGFTVGALEAVGSPNEAPDVLEALVALREKSLVHASSTNAGRATRFGVYASIRQFASERLDELGLLAETEVRHRRYFAGRARAVTDDRSAPCMVMMREDRDEFVAALERAFSSDDHVDARSDALAILALLSTEIAGPGDPLVTLFERAIERFVEDDLPSGRALYAWGRISIQLDAIHRSRDAFERALAIGEKHGDSSLMARASLGLVHLAPNAGSMQKLAESLELARKAKDSTAEAGMLARMALARCNEGGAEEAMTLADDAVAASKNPIDVATNRTIRALVHLAMGQLAAAETDVLAALDEAERHGLVTVVAYAEKARSSLAHITGPFNEAEAAYRSSVARCLEVGQKAMAAGVRVFLALLLLENGLVDACLAELRLAAPVLDERYDPLKPPALASALEALAHARSSGAPVDRRPFRVKRSAELAEVLERLDVLADLENARSEMTRSPAEAQSLARVAQERFALLANSAKQGSVERAVIDSVVRRELSSWENPAAKIAMQLVVNGEGDWFRTPGGPIVLSSHRPVLRRLLAKLGNARHDHRGVPVPVAELREAAWPGEKMSDGSARNRLKQSMAMLRKLGLAELLERRGNGYLLSGTVPFRLTNGWES